jgi:uncharacterized glyoxalase superfamily protein PhnB
MMQKLSPVLVLDAIEPSLPFFRDRLGFEVTVSVPLREGAAELGFAILQRDAVEVMLQTRASVRGDVPALADEPNRATLYLDVADVAAIERQLAGCEIVVPRRRTFYGADEIGVRAPGGHVLLFAQHGT